MSFEQAKQKATKIDPQVDTVLEYRDFWVFFKSGRKTQDGEICIEKKTGDRVSYAELVIDNRIEEVGELRQL